MVTKAPLGDDGVHSQEFDVLTPTMHPTAEIGRPSGVGGVGADEYRCHDSLLSSV